MPTAVILAGGLGTRLRSAVPDLPKPMAPIAGRPFLAHQMDHWIDQGVRHFVLSVGYRHEAISDHFGDSYQGARLTYVVEQTPLGTGGAWLLAAQHVNRDHPVLLLNGDTYFDVRLLPLQAFAAEHDSDWCFSLFRANEPGRYMGLQVGDDGRITALAQDDQRIGRLANGGVYLVHPRALPPLGAVVERPLSLEADLFPAWLAAGRRFHGLDIDAPFIDIGVPHDYHRAASVLPAGPRQPLTPPTGPTP